MVGGEVDRPSRIGTGDAELEPRVQVGDAEPGEGVRAVAALQPLLGANA